MTEIALVGKKIGMTREFYKTGRLVPVTVIKMEKARVISVIEQDKRGYKAVQLGFGNIKSSKLTKAMKGMYAKKNTEAKKKLKEFRVKNTDVYKEGKDAIELGYMKLTGDTDNQVKTIRSRVDEVCGNGVLTDLKRSMVTYRILNRFIKYGKVISFTMPGSAKEWVKNSKFKDIEPTYDAFGTLTKRGLKYTAVATSTLHKSFMKAVILAHENPDCDIRVLVHTGTLTGFDAEQTYAHKLWKFRKEWIQMLTELSFAFFNKANYSSTPILLYGALPSVQDMGDLKSLKKFVSYSEASFEDIINNGDFNDGLQDI